MAEIAGFYDHRVKLAAAEEHIPEQSLLLYEGSFQRTMVQTNAFDVSISADLEARLDSLYVDWDGENWSVGVHVDPAVLADNIAAVSAILARVRAEWPLA